MAKKATSKSATPKRAKPARKAAPKPRTAVARVSPRHGSSDGPEIDGVGDAFVKLMQSPFVADLIAVAATAALAALAEHGFSSRGASGGSKRAGKAVREAGKAAAAAVGRRLGNELDEIREAAKARAGA